MKNRIFLSVAPLFFLFNSQVQSLTVRPEIGLNIAKVDLLKSENKSDVSNIIGPRVGIYVRVPAGSNSFYIEPGLFYSQKGYRLNDLIFEPNFNPGPVTGKTTTSDVTYRVHTLELPLNILYELSLKKAGKLFAGFGPYFGANIGGYRIIESEGKKDERELEFGKNKPDGVVVDFGVNGGIGYEAPFRLYARIQSGYGIPEFLNSSAWERNKVLTIAVGYSL